MTSIEDRIIATLEKHGAIQRDSLMKMIFRDVTLSAKGSFIAAINNMAEKKIITLNKTKIQLT